MTPLTNDTFLDLLGLKPLLSPAIPASFARMEGWECRVGHGDSQSWHRHTAQSHGPVEWSHYRLSAFFSFGMVAEALRRGTWNENERRWLEEMDARNEAKHRLLAAMDFDEGME